MNESAFDIEKFIPEDDQYIEASAGTGKTFTIRKISAELVKKNIPLSDVLFVTYTEKAAGEMRDRIREEMTECLAKATSSTEKTQFERACQDVDKAVIGTIHSFCRKTLHDFAYEADVPFDMENADNQAAEIIVDRLIRDEWEDELAVLSFLQEKPAPKYIEEIKELLVKGLKEYSPEKDPIDSPMTLRDWIRLNPKANKYWKVLANKKDGKFFAMDHGREKEFSVSALVEKINAWTGKGVLFSGLGTVFSKCSDPDLGLAVSYFFSIRSDEVKFISDEKFKKCSFLNKKAKDLYELWQQEKELQKVQSFNDMISKVRVAVCPNGKIPDEPTFLCKKLRDTYKIAIIDEFQDTNEFQWNIFETVFLKSDRNHLIVVGDPKQSIYSFQGADLQVYRRARDCIKKGSALKTNFRSSISMINACNSLFLIGDESKYPFLPKGDFETSNVPKESKNQRQNALFNGVEISPILVSPIVPEKGFARFAVQKIIDCCSVKNEKTALQVFDRGKSEPRNVNFSDFVILGRTRPEMDEIKKCLADVGVPFVQYKDATLFDSKECMEWISVLKMLAAPNLTGYNAKILNSVFVTDFFGTDLCDLTDDPQLNADEEAFQKITHWRFLASKKMWTELQEQIYEETQVEKKLSKPNKLQELMKLRQIGNYIFGYLYEKKATLQQAIKHLETLSNDNKKAGDEEKNIVAKGTDFKAVNLMTIHASKGLEFPVVISCAGFKGVNDKADGPFVFNVDVDDEGDCPLQKKCFGYDDFSKKMRQSEEIDEWHRLLYVDYTRASSLLILPQYDRWYKCEKRGNSIVKETRYNLKMNKLVKDCNNCEIIDDNSSWSFLAYAHREICKEKKYAKLCEWNGDWNEESLKSSVNEELAFFNKEDSVDETELPSKETIDDLRDAIADSALYQHSYSSIDKKSSGVEIQVIDDNLVNPAGEEPESELPTADDLTDDYPRGNHYGDALHHIFEKLDFVRIGNLSLEDAKSDSELQDLIEDSFLSNGLPIGKHPDWMTKTVEIVWGTMNAAFPVLCGTEKTNEKFYLKNLEASQRLAEMEFKLKADEKKDIFKTLCKGFMDLVFVRNDGRYCVLDWKSNRLEKYDSVSTFEAVKEHYSIQLVLYSYCLIMWLNSIIADSTPEQIFNEKFGGIYYVFARGCHLDSGDGIYVHSWKCFTDLQNDYKKVWAKMLS